MSIRFYRVGEPNGFMSNFYPAPFDAWGVEWPTSEHYFQAAKFFETDPTWAEAVRVAPTASEAAKRGRNRSHPIDPRWDDGMRVGAMMLALVLKFKAHHDLRGRLLSTGDEMLIEHTANDSYWGDGGDGSGRNRLGLLLMELRNALTDPLLMCSYLMRAFSLLGLKFELDQT